MSDVVTEDFHRISPFEPEIFTLVPILSRPKHTARVTRKLLDS